MFIIFEGRRIETDAEGYLKNSKDWYESMVYLLAEQEKIVLTEPHLEIIRFVRTFYQEFNLTPTVRMLVKAVAKKYGEAMGNSIYLYSLFPKGPATQAIKLAGLPNPVKCI